ncbi:recombinase family protein [Vibrio campbellii]
MYLVDILQRVSSKKQSSDERTGLQRQDYNTSNWLASRSNYRLRHTIILKGESAYSGRHLDGDFGSYLDDLTNGTMTPPHTLLIDDFSRLSRMPLNEAERLVMKLTDLGITIVTASDDNSYAPSDTNSLESRIGLILKLKASHEESERKSRHLRSANVAKTEAIKSGKQLRTKRLPFWLSVSDNGRFYVVDEDKASIAVLVHELYQSNHTLTDIMRHLKTAGIPTVSTRTTEWTRKTLLNILQSESLFGRITFNHADRETEYLDDHFPVVLSRESFDLTQALLKETKNTRSGKGSAVFRNVFRGLLRCGDCYYTCSVKHNKGQSYSYVYCEGRKRKGYNIGDCHNKSYRHDKLLDKVLYLLQNVELVDSGSTVSATDLQLRISQKEDEFSQQSARLLKVDNSLFDVLQPKVLDLKSEIEELRHQLHMLTISEESTGSTLIDNLERIDTDTEEGRRSLNKHLSRYLSEITYSRTADTLVLTRKLDGKQLRVPLSLDVSFEEERGFYFADYRHEADEDREDDFEDVPHEPTPVRKTPNGKVIRYFGDDADYD